MTSTNTVTTEVDAAGTIDDEADRIAPYPGATAVSPAVGPNRAARVLTLLIVGGPIAFLGAAIPFLWGHALSWRDLLVAIPLYVVTAHGISVGFHRYFTHRSFEANRGVKIALAVAGSMAVEGSVIGWTAAHRRHHRFSDRAGDPHSPHVLGDRRLSVGRGLLHTHVGWLFTADATSEQRYAADLLADRDLVWMSRYWSVFALGSLVVPFGVGWLWSGSVIGALTMFMWAGLARMVLLHHVTWSINSICHVFGDRPFRTRDHSGNVAALAVLSGGESLHNFHHACPTSARHGVLRHQPDSSAGVIRILERLGWVSDVRWPDPARVFSLVQQPGRFDAARIKPLPRSPGIATRR